MWVSQLKSLIVELAIKEEKCKNTSSLGIFSILFLFQVILLRFSICTQLYVKCVKKLKSVTHI
jgi:hypothetical protein